MIHSNYSEAWRNPNIFIYVLMLQSFKVYYLQASRCWLHGQPFRFPWNIPIVFSGFVKAPWPDLKFKTFLRFHRCEVTNIEIIKSGWTIDPYSFPVECYSILSQFMSLTVVLDYLLLRIQLFCIQNLVLRRISCSIYC